MQVKIWVPPSKIIWVWLVGWGNNLDFNDWDERLYPGKASTLYSKPCLRVLASFRFPLAHPTGIVFQYRYLLESTFPISMAFGLWISVLYIIRRYACLSFTIWAPTIRSSRGLLESGSSRSLIGVRSSRHNVVADSQSALDHNVLWSSVVDMWEVWGAGTGVTY